jgi:hypothetical protein
MKRVLNNIRLFVVRILGLRGSWGWAKKQMLKGRIVRCSHWSGTLKYRIDTRKNTLLQCSFSKDMNNLQWETSNHFLCYEDLTDYEIVERFNHKGVDCIPLGLEHKRNHRLLTLENSRNTNFPHYGF